jgi:hypothetical protein
MSELTSLALASTTELADELGRRALAADNGALILGLTLPSEENNQKPVVRVFGYGTHPATSQQLMRGLCSVYQLRSTSGDPLVVPAPIYPGGRIEVSSSLQKAVEEVESQHTETSLVTIQEIVTITGDIVTHFPETVVTRSRTSLRLQSRLSLKELSAYLAPFGYSRLPTERVEVGQTLPPEAGMYIQALAEVGGVIDCFISNTSPVSIAVVAYDGVMPEGDGSVLKEVALVSRGWVFKFNGQ